MQVRYLTPAEAEVIKAMRAGDVQRVRDLVCEAVGSSLPTVTGPTVSSPHGPIAAIKSFPWDDES